MEEGSWQKPKNLIQMNEMVVVTRSSAEAATSLTVKENRLAESANAPGVIYTLLIGPEEEEASEDGVARRTRIAAIRGVYRVTEGRVSAVSPKSSARASYSERPKGTVKF